MKRAPSLLQTNRLNEEWIMSWAGSFQRQHLPHTNIYNIFMLCKAIRKQWNRFWRRDKDNDFDQDRYDIIDEWYNIASTKTRILSKSSLPLYRRRIMKSKSKQISQHEVHLHNPNTILKNHHFFITTIYTTRKMAKLGHTDFMVSIAYAPSLFFCFFHWCPVCVSEESHGSKNWYLIKICIYTAKISETLAGVFFNATEVYFFQFWFFVTGMWVNSKIFGCIINAANMRANQRPCVWASGILLSLISKWNSAVGRPSLCLQQRISLHMKHSCAYIFKFKVLPLLKYA